MDRQEKKVAGETTGKGREGRSTEEEEKGRTQGEEEEGKGVLLWRKDIRKKKKVTEK